MTLVSILVPLYNHERYILDCLQSIVLQDYPNIEVIIIDDGSTDASYEVVSRWRDANSSRFVRLVLLRQDNAGICKTLNRAARASAGELLIPLASDDLLLPHSIGHLVRATKLYPKGTLWFTDTSLIGPSGEPISDSAYRTHKRNIDVLQNVNRLFYEALFRWGTPLQHQIFDRVLYDALCGYNEDLKFEDIDFALRALAKGRAVLINLPVKQYRIRIGNTGTPGLSGTDILPIESRVAARRNFAFFKRSLIDLVNARDLAPFKGLRYRVLSGIIRLICESVFYYYNIRIGSTKDKNLRLV